MEVNYRNAVNEVSRELNIPREVVDKTYKAYWLFINQTVQSLPLKETLTEESFTKLKTNINIPSLGKLYCTYDKVLRIKNKYLEYIKEK